MQGAKDDHARSGQEVDRPSPAKTGKSTTGSEEGRREEAGGEEGGTRQEVGDEEGTCEEVGGEEGTCEEDTAQEGTGQEVGDQEGARSGQGRTREGCGREEEDGHL